MITPNYIRRKLHNLTHPVLGRILMLHRVVEHRSDKPEQRELEVTPQFLEQKILEYKSKGYTFVSIDDITHLSPLTSRLSPFVCLTFDDGYQDNYDIAYPILKKNEVPFAIYVTTGFIDNRISMWWYPNESLGLKHDKLLVLDAEPLCTIGAHTISHPRLDTLSLEEQRKEIMESKTLLEQCLGHSIDHFSYPHGAYNENSLHIVHDCNFLSALHAWGGPVRRGENHYLLPRIELRQL